MASGVLAGAAGIAREVIPRVRPPVCCVQYGYSGTVMTSIMNYNPDYG